MAVHGSWCYNLVSLILVTCPNHFSLRLRIFCILSSLCCSQRIRFQITGFVFQSLLRSNDVRKCAVPLWRLKLHGNRSSTVEQPATTVTAARTYILCIQATTAKVPVCLAIWAHHIVSICFMHSLYKYSVYMYIYLFIIKSYSRYSTQTHIIIKRNSEKREWW